MTEPIPFRRNGDIIILLPLLKKMADASGKSVRLFVTEECMPLLEGVSYVIPLQSTAFLNGVIDAHVFHRGLIPTTLPNNYAELAWHRLGHKWDANLPLVFDRRDLKRERKLAKAVFKTDKPKLLLKLEGNSSPLPDADVIRARITELFGAAAEVVCLDGFKADRIYDLIGLMNHCACMVTVDTATLWLAHASRCPVIALVHPHDYRSSPPRGNCLLRVRYADIEKQWPDIVKQISSTLDLPLDNSAAE